MTLADFIKERECKTPLVVQRAGSSASPLETPSRRCVIMIKSSWNFYFKAIYYMYEKYIPHKPAKYCGIRFF